MVLIKTFYVSEQSHDWLFSHGVIVLAGCTSVSDESSTLWGTLLLVFKLVRDGDLFATWIIIKFNLWRFLYLPLIPAFIFGASYYLLFYICLDPQFFEKVAISLGQVDHLPYEDRPRIHNKNPEMTYWLDPDMRRAMREYSRENTKGFAPHGWKTVDIPGPEGQPTTFVPTTSEDAPIQLTPEGKRQERIYYACVTVAVVVFFALGYHYYLDGGPNGEVNPNAAYWYHRMFPRPVVEQAPAVVEAVVNPVVNQVVDPAQDIVQAPARRALGRAIRRQRRLREFLRQAMMPPQ